jgi:amino acid adenylation domain-containing protein
MENIESIYPLSPMQQGMMFHTIYAPESGLYFEQLSCRFHGNFNISAFKQAWQQVVDRYSVLRTAFHWNKLEEPMQVVYKKVTLPWALLDWRGLSVVKQREQLDTFIKIDRASGFALAKAPLLRFTLIQLAEDIHQFIWSHHHLLIDGWSLSIVLKEVFACYKAQCQGVERPVEYPRRPYRDYIAWLQQQNMAQAEAFWRKKLKGFLAPTPLTIETSYLAKKPVQVVAEQEIQLSNATTEALQILARQHKITLNTLVQGAWALLLNRYSGDHDVVFGATVSGRQIALAEVESMVGLFINTLPVRVRFSENMTLLPWLIQLQAEQIEREQYAYSPLVDIQGWSEVPRGTPLFESILVFENYPVDESLLAATSHLTLSQVESFEQSNYPLGLICAPGQQLSLKISYDVSRFEAATIARLLEHLQKLLAGIITHPEQRITELPLLTEAEQHQLLIEWNDTQATYPQEKCIHQLFEAQVEKTPDAIAVVFEDQQLSYQALNVRANQLAHYLQTLGVKPEVLVGICVERSLEMIIGLVGILKTGGAYVPLDPSYPPERLAFMLEDSQVQVLLTQHKLIDVIKNINTKYKIDNRIVYLDTDWEIFSKASSNNLASRVQADNLAYVIYTSGSTGQPKGVLLEHQGLCNLAKAQIQLFNVQPDSRVLQFASISFDASIWEIVMALGSGATLCLGTTESLILGTDLTQQLHEQTITHVTLPPSALAVPTTDELLDLQYIIVAGEVCPPDLAAQWSQGRHFFNAYGPTESTVCATVFEYSVERRPILPIGRPIANTQLYILDNQLNPVPIGVPDELHIGGVGLARGYLNSPDLTQEKFIPNPFSDEPGARLYKTGDLARYLSDGNIEFLGRIDNQVKLRGFRIELGEIEAVLSQHPNVRETVLIAREDQPGNKRLVAYMVSDLIPERIPYQSECLAKLNGKTLKLRTEDISSGGVLLGTDVSLTENQEISLRLLLPGASDARWLKGKVAWSRASWAGIEFELTPKEHAIIDNSIEYLLESQGLLKVVQRLLTGNLRDYLKDKLPDYMVPSNFVLLHALPLTPNGKLDRRALPAPEAVYLPKKTSMPETEAERVIAAVWQEVLHIDNIGIYDNFFDLGGHSLLLPQIQTKLQDKLGCDIPMVELFEYATIHALAQHLRQKQSCVSALAVQPQPSQKRTKNRRARQANDIAIIGLSGRFPDASTLEAFWRNLQDGKEAISFFADDELISEGIDTATLNQPNYVKAGTVLSDIEQFDAAFFDFSPKEAEVTDPQHRLFLECAWEALENAGYEAGTDEYSIGVYAGVGMNTYLLSNLYPNRERLSESVGSFQVLIENDKDFLPTRVSYKLNLTGPSINVQTACSTSLVATHLACQSLLEGECDIALAGGVTVHVPQKVGYWYQAGMIMSPDGHCRAFDAQAQGTVGGNGVGIVVLKRLEDAIADGDCIHAIIKGSAINNDGSLKVGYTAPSIEGQKAVISEAQAVAGVDAESITYIETHGTGTALGDPIEITALTKAFQASTQKKGFCAIGSLKTNIGHTDTAAGVAGLIKTVLALKHQKLPPSLHFSKPNPKIDFAKSPFYVNTKLADWQPIDGMPRRAGVSSFGIGGTNAHVILEEAPTRVPSGKSRPWQLLVLSAKTDSALETASANLAAYLAQHPDINIADVAYTLSKGRKAFSHRRMLLCQKSEEATTALRTVDPTRVFTQFQAPKKRPVVFMFSGQGAQYVNMGLELYQTESIFREQVDRCAEFLKPHLGLDLRTVLYPTVPHTSSFDPENQLNQTAITQPALFVIEYALAKLWMTWGVHPEAMIGHSIGEYVAACLAGVFSVKEALLLVAARGQLMQQMPRGTMLTVPLPEKQVKSLLSKGLSLAAVNAPARCVVSGFTSAVEALQNQLTEQGVECRRLHTSHAFHSEMMNPILKSFTERVNQVNLCSPKLAYLSNVTGTWITDQEATNPNYWASHLRQPVRFAEGLQQLLTEPARILLEVGPGRTLSTLTRRHPQKVAEQVVLSSLRHPQDNQQSDVAFLLTSLGKFWLAGGQLKWSGFYTGERRHRLPLPTYPFERQRYWIEPPKQQPSEGLKSLEGYPLSGKKPDIADWFYQPLWKQSVAPIPSKPIESALWLIFDDVCGLGAQLVKNLELQEIITVKVGSVFTKLSDHDYTLNPQLSSDYEALVKALRTRDKMPATIVHLWGVTPNEPHNELAVEGFDQAQALGFYCLLFLAQALGKQNVTEAIQIAVVSNNMQSVSGDEMLCPEKATVLGPVKVIGQEYPNLNCRSIDVVIPNSPLHHDNSVNRLIESLLAELTNQSSDRVVAYRGKHRWVPTFEPVRLEKPLEDSRRLREKGVYLITGGLGNIGLALAEHLAKTVQAKLVLMGRSALPAKNDWDDWLSSHNEDESISRKIRKVQALEEQGAEVLVVSADVADLQQMQEVIAMAEKRFGQLNGVIHAAGITSERSFQAVEQIGKTEGEQQFQPKVHGTLVLEKVLSEKTLDFCLLFSSLSSVLGGLGFLAYSAANLFMDAFAHQQSSTVPWLSVNWDGWRFGNVTKPGTSFGATLAELAMTPEEGINAFQRILAAPQTNQLIVSTGDLQARIEQWIKRDFGKARDHSQKQESSARYSRPSLPTPYIAPRNQLEQTLAEIWQQFLGIDQIGIFDEFFDLGGDSLIAVQLIAKLHEVVQVELSPHSFLEASTIAELAQLIKRQSPAVQPSEPTLPSSLVEIQAGNKLKQPLFLVHPAGGQIYVYRDLVQCLGPNQPVYGLQQVDYDGKLAFHLERVEDLAAYYIQALRIVQPTGPYFLGGSSFGGTIAFEMAQQLQTVGQKVALLAMIDTACEGNKQVGFDDDAVILTYLLNVGQGFTLSENEIRQMSEEQLRYFLLQNDSIKNLPEDLLEHSHDYLRLFKLNRQAAAEYQPQLYSGRILFFRARERDAFNPPHPEQGWDELASGGVEIYEVPGNHITMNSLPHVKAIAEKLKSFIETANPDNIWLNLSAADLIEDIKRENINHDEVKDRVRRFYNAVTQQLDSTEFGQHALFLNYGYVADETPQHATIELPKHLINRNSIKLVLELIGDCDLTDCRILDTGCGRGGTISVIAEYFQAKEITGLDLSPTAIAFCQANCSYNQVQFIEGDAEDLPFDDEQFEFVINIESASGYPNIAAFFAQVYRVLKEGGYFLYTDALPTELISGYLSTLQELGFIIEIERDITRNVLLSCDDVANRHLAAFSKKDDEAMSNFLGLPGSEVYTALENRTLTYKMFRFKKPPRSR